MGNGNPAFRVLRVLRVLRPLRLVARFSGMRLAIGLLLKALPRVVDVFVVFLLFLVVFSILGVQVRVWRALSLCLSASARLLPSLSHPPRLCTRSSSLAASVGARAPKAHLQSSASSTAPGRSARR